MPDENGLDLIPRIRKIRPSLRVIVMSAQNTLLTAVKAGKGAHSITFRSLSISVNWWASSSGRSATRFLSPPPNKLERKSGLPIIGRSPAMQEIYRILARLMGTDLTVMISGESRAREKNWWRKRCTTTASAGPARSSRSTWLLSRAS